MAEETKNYMLEDEETSGFDYKAFFIKLLMYWPWILISIAVFLIGAFFYLKTLTPLYTVNSSVLIKNESKGGANGASLEDLGFVWRKTVERNRERLVLTRKLFRICSSIFS